jgi:hypothetical protein
MLALLGATLPAFVTPCLAGDGRLNPPTQAGTNTNKSTVASSLSVYECSLSPTASSSLSGCTNNYDNLTQTTTFGLTSDGTCNTGSAPYCGARSDANSGAITPIDAWGSCYWVTNNTSNNLFVPFRSSTEWSNFISNHPTGVTLTACAWPYARELVLNPSYASPSVPGPYAGCNSVPVNTPSVYGLIGSSVYPTTANLQILGGGTPTLWTCHDGLTIEALPQWKALNVGGNNIWSPNFVFGPDVTITAQDTTAGRPAAPDSINADAGDTVKLSWTITPALASGGSVAFSSTPSGWNGITNVTPAVNTTYTVQVTDTNNLTSTTSVIVNIVAAGKCGSNGSGTLPSPLCTGTGNTASSAVQGTSSSGINGYTWTCTSAAGDQTSCSALQTAASCGSTTIDTSSGSPNFTDSSTACIVGTPSSITASGSSYSYSCSSSYGSASSTATCSANAAPNGSCYLSETLTLNGGSKLQQQRTLAPGQTYTESGAQPGWIGNTFTPNPGHVWQWSCADSDPCTFTNPIDPSTGYQGLTITCGPAAPSCQAGP